VSRQIVLLEHSAEGFIVAFLLLRQPDMPQNAVAPGPIWTPLIPASFPRKKVATFGSDVPLGRAGEPAEVAPSYAFLASADAASMTGQVLHPNGGEIVNG
jgi:NAD(P)-dependent dehydrogenase (short-subunit alcohol dehydrogenase family)